MRKLLLSNDDGVHAPGLKALYEALSVHARLRVVAPDRDKSGASNSLTLSRPLALSALDNGFYSVDGTPADCVYLGVNGIWDEKPDLVISGINHGGNLGMAAIAVSLVGAQHFETAGRVAASLVGAADTLSLPPRSLLNVNVPDLPWEEIRGFRVTRMGYRGPAQRPLEVEDPRGRTRYWIAPVGENADDGPDTDFAAVEAGYVSITPLHTDLTRHAAINDVRGWLDALSGQG